MLSWPRDTCAGNYHCLKCGDVLIRMMQDRYQMKIIIDDVDDDNDDADDVLIGWQDTLSNTNCNTSTITNTNRNTKMVMLCSKCLEGPLVKASRRAPVSKYRAHVLFCQSATTINKDET